jgi:hypothetical protein
MSELLNRSIHSNPDSFLRRANPSQEPLRVNRTGSGTSHLIVKEQNPLSGRRPSRQLPIVPETGRNVKRLAAHVLWKYVRPEEKETCRA